MKNLWFATLDSHSLCRGGGNGPDHPSQLYALGKYLEQDMSLLDYGCGSGTTYEALMNVVKKLPSFNFKYRGTDIIAKNIAWCKSNLPGFEGKVNKHLHKISEPNQRYDIVYSRHVVDHMRSFEEAMDEHCRVAKKYVIATLFVPLSESEDHEIKHIITNNVVHENEYQNRYSRKKVMQWIDEKTKEGWELVEMAENVGSEVRGNDWVLVLKRI
jgi:ubiquinone/menaquinone biosynthesis C-methylase UbiE